MPDDRRARIIALDALRGAVMIIMALDHVRDFVHRAAMSSSPTDLATTTPAIFMTRWFTHFCAPVFVFTAGAGAYFWWQNHRTRPQLSLFLLTRGLWLIVLELTVMRLAYNFNWSAQYPVLLLVLWVLGACMVVMAALIWLPMRSLALASIAVILLHDLADGIRAAQLGAAAPLWNFLHQAGAFRFAGYIFVVGCPLVPWVAVIALGFCAGPIFTLPPARRRRVLLRLGAGATAAYIALRAINIYGDPAPWSAQTSAVFTMLSFLNTTKYPPSLIFLLMTLGPALIALAYLDRRELSRANPLVVFGRVPLFYFIAHFYAAHVLAVVLGWLRYGSQAAAFTFHPVPSMGGPQAMFPEGFGYSLPTTYAAWLGIVVALYPLCRWFARLKERRCDWWLSYL